MNIPRATFADMQTISFARRIIWFFFIIGKFWEEMTNRGVRSEDI